MCLVVVTVADVGRSNEEFKRVILIQIQCACFDLLLQLSHALLPIAAEAEVFFVAPQYRGSCSDAGFRQHVMQNDNLISPTISHHNKHGPMLQSDSILYPL